MPVAELAEAPLALALPRGHPLAGRAGRCALEDLVDARWIDAPDVTTPLAGWRCSPAPTASGPRCATTALDVGGLLALVDARRRASRCCPARRRAAAGVPVVSPPLVHRTELLAVDVRERPDQIPALVASVFPAVAAGPATPAR